MSTLTVSLTDETTGVVTMQNVDFIVATLVVNDPGNQQGTVGSPV